MKSKFVYIYTIGCQMNVYDSEQFLKALKPLGYQETCRLEAADLVLVNTCAIREKAQEKAFSFLGRLLPMKKKKPHLIIGMGGCVAQQEGRHVIQRVPHIDLVFGTHAIQRLAMHIQNLEKQKERVVDVEIGSAIYEPPSLKPLNKRKEAGHFVTIMQGCDNFCTYCVVPYTRGRECSRQPEHILQEIEALVASGIKEITLLGQNVNSYGNKEGLCSFPQLLERIHEIRDLKRIRFATSHPKDFSDELIRSFQTLDKLCRHIHLPVQSGSSRVLKRMNRRYTREDYLHKVEKLRRFSPEVALSSDMIVGFPGETRKDFEDTLSLIKTVEFDSLFAFAYSDRPNAPAAHFPGKVSEAEKKERLQALLNLQEKITLKKNQDLVGRDVEILVEGKSKKQHRAPTQPEESGSTGTLQWTGRTSDNKIVNFNASVSDRFHPVDVGHLVTITIEKAYPHSLWGIKA
jgi:tRNA-2-methylthio-N6-dimethylallyladenosine synthase